MSDALQHRGAAFVAARPEAWEVTGPGVRRQILAHDQDIMIVAVEFEAGAVGPVHAHVHRQATYVASGRFLVTVGDGQRELRTGDSFFAAPNVPHGVTALDAGTLIDTFTPGRQDFLGFA